jgi:membrane protein implicated in regulation of membrane protease activity
LTPRRWQVLVLVAIALAAASILVSAALFSSVAGQQDKLNAESVRRRDQNCIVFERISQVSESGPVDL